MWTRTAHGLYSWSAVDPDHVRQRILIAAARLPSSGAVTGWAAAWVHGAARLDGLRGDATTPLPVPVCLTPDHQLRNAARAGLKVSRSRLEPGERVSVRDVPCTHLVRTAFDAARFAENVMEAVVALDALLHSTALRVEEVVAYAHERPRWHGRDQLYRAAALANAWSLSCQESRLRVMWREAGLPRPLVNPFVLDRSGTVVAMADLLDEAAALVIEYDGAHHADARQRARDDERTQRLHALGLHVVRVSSLDLRADRRWTTMYRLRQLHERRAAAQTGPRAWTAQPQGDHDVPARTLRFG
ncbi:MAG TPA: DUF559 domain-containing protein [Actinomycetales bacterium]|nr:DUF559 domain-containing protein [Actinomycetales bacterium]